MDPSEIRTRALNFLARREYSRSELAARLAEKDADRETIDAVLGELEQAGWLSDKRYVEQVLNARLGRYGREHVVHELRAKGVSEILIEDALPSIMEAENDALRSVWEKKFGEKPANRKELARQVRFLQSRGFSLGEILKLIGHIED